MSTIAKQARNRMRDASEAFERNRWNEAVSILQETSALYEKSLSEPRRTEESSDTLKFAAMARMTRSLGAFIRILSLGPDDSEHALQLSQTTSDDLRVAGVLFEKAGLKEEAAYARSLMQLSRAKFYHEHAKRQLQTYNNEKAMKYFKNAVDSSHTAIIMLLEASFSRLLESDRADEVIRSLERQPAASSERIQLLERKLAQANEELIRYKKQLTLPEPTREVVPELKTFAKSVGRNLRYAKLSFAAIAILIVVYFGLVVTSSFHIASIFDAALLLPAALATPIVILIIRQKPRFRNLASRKMQMT